MWCLERNKGGYKLNCSSLLPLFFCSVEAWCPLITPLILWIREIAGFDSTAEYMVELMAKWAWVTGKIAVCSLALSPESCVGSYANCFLFSVHIAFISQSDNKLFMDSVQGKPLPDLSWQWAAELKLPLVMHALQTQSFNTEGVSWWVPTISAAVLCPYIHRNLLCAITFKQRFTQVGLIPFPIVNNHKLKIDVAGGWFDTHLLRSGLVTDVCELVSNGELCTLTEQPLTALNRVCVLLALLKVHCPLGFRENRHLIDKTFSIFFRKPYGHPRSFLFVCFCAGWTTCVSKLCFVWPSWRTPIVH